jgi:hypothetical protein
MLSRSSRGRSKKVFCLRGWACTLVSSHAPFTDTGQPRSSPKLAVVITYLRRPCPLDRADRPRLLKFERCCGVAKLSSSCQIAMGKKSLPKSLRALAGR